jgi:hypothetical protein
LKNELLEADELAKQSEVQFPFPLLFLFYSILHTDSHAQNGEQHPILCLGRPGERGAFRTPKSLLSRDRENVIVKRGKWDRENVAFPLLH